MQAWETKRKDAEGDGGRRNEWINILVGKVSVVSWTVDFCLYLCFISQLNTNSNSVCLHCNSALKLV